MDITSFDTRTRANEGVEIELLSLKTGRGSGSFIKVIGTDSDKFIDLSTQRARAMSELMAQSPNGEIDRKDMVRFTVDLLVGCTLGWRGLESDGKPLEFSPANARMLYESFPAIRQQINEATAERKNFLLA